MKKNPNTTAIPHRPAGPHQHRTQPQSTAWSNRSKGVELSTGAAAERRAQLGHGDHLALVPSLVRRSHSDSGPTSIVLDSASTTTTRTVLNRSLCMIEQLKTVPASIATFSGQLIG